jgi:FMN phosphatase YigB (HAD superfamily)
MSRPLVISDCDEVLLHMIAPYREWLGETQGITFRMDTHNFVDAMRWSDTGEPVEPSEIWRLLNAFFETEMYRQTPIAGAVEAMRALSRVADVVVLTNVGDEHHERRTRQLAGHGLDLKVFTNLGPKGPALQRILAEYRPTRAAFIDDIAHHHNSVAELAPEVIRLHFCGEPELAPKIACAHEAGHAHARIDDWASALPWLLARLEGESE